MRHVTPEDVCQIAALEMIVFPDNCFNEYTLGKEIRAGVAWGIEGDDGELVAYALTRFDGAITDLTRLGVRPDYQQKGLGARLLECVVANSGDLMLTVAKGNAPALRLYTRYGFQVVGELGPSNWVMRRATSAVA